MAYETSYDTGLKPFNHDKNRGKWSSPRDFFFACVGHAFKVDAVFILPMFLFSDIGVYTLIPYLIILAVSVVPIVFMQSFLGQFSSTGFISVFRLSPLFKGIGYVSLAINLISLTYYAVLGAIPLFYFLYTLRPTIPWSCEGAKSWMVVNENRSSICDYNNETHVNYTKFEIPSMEFLDRELNTMAIYHNEHPEGRFSWLLMLCTFLIWGMVATIAIKPIESIGKFLRFSCITVLGIMGLCLIRFAFLPGAFDVLTYFFAPWIFSFEYVIGVPLMAFTALGPGWGSVLTMASYNKFDTNIYRYSWLICLAQVGILLGLAFLSFFITGFLTRMDEENIDFKYVNAQWMEFLSIPTAITFMELPHIWSLLFFAMIILGCINLIVVQFISTLTSIFDEFENLRVFKKELKITTVGIMALASIFFCSNYGITVFESLTTILVITQMILNFFLLIIVVWIYGRERFQRDVCFMTNRTYATWMLNIVRFAAPIVISFSLVIAVILAVVYLSRGNVWSVTGFAVTIAVMSWLFIPGYCFFKIYQTSGILGMRLKRCIRPTDWYPGDPVDRRRYEEKFSETEISHNLFTETAE